MNREKLINFLEFVDKTYDDDIPYETVFKEFLDSKVVTLVPLPVYDEKTFIRLFPDGANGTGITITNI